VAAAVVVVVGTLAAVAMRHRSAQQAEWVAQHSHPVGADVPGASDVKPSAYGPPVSGGKARPVGGTRDAGLGGNTPLAETAPRVETAPRIAPRVERSEEPAPVAAPVEGMPAAPVVRVPPADGSGRAPETPSPQALRRLPGRGGETAVVGMYMGRRSLPVSAGVMTGRLISSPAPEYPLLAKFTHVEGQVVVQAVVSRNGTVVATRVLRGPRLLRGAAESAVKQWRYRPYVLNGRPMDVATVVMVDFRRGRKS